MTHLSSVQACFSSSCHINEPASLHVDTNMESTDHVTAAETTCSSPNQHQNGEDLRGFKRLTVTWLLEPDGLVSVVLKVLFYWDFHPQPSAAFPEMV